MHNMEHISKPAADQQQHKSHCTECGREMSRCDAMQFEACYWCRLNGPKYPVR